MPLVRITEENIVMKVSLMSLTFGFFLVVGLPLASWAGPLPGGADTDGDTVEDAFDNCTAIPNASQADKDHDGCGNACDCDVTGDGVVGVPDYVQVVNNFGTMAGGPADCSGDTAVGVPDYVTVVNGFGNPPGPSGITNPSKNTLLCQ
jgi:Thrombospondin type 3 repeat